MCYLLVLVDDSDFLSSSKYNHKTTQKQHKQ